MPYRVTDACILCGACVVGCESNAITEGETQAHNRREPVCGVRHL